MERKCYAKIATYNIWNNEEQDKREKHILRELHIAEADIVGLQEVTDDFYVLLGDFNGNMNSSVNRYLLGDQTINGYESNLYWNDLQSGYCVRKGTSLTPTLDFINNPRWAGKETITVPMVTDRIYVMESWDDIDMNGLVVFGTEVYPDIEMTASDHYGIVAELEFSK